MAEPDVTPMEEPLAALERRLINEYLERAGEDLEALRTRNDEAAHKIMRDAITYAAIRLSEVESRAHYVRELHDTDRK
jgi:hypothetical protein